MVVGDSPRCAGGGSILGKVGFLGVECKWFVNVVGTFDLWGGRGRKTRENFDKNEITNCFRNSGNVFLQHSPTLLYRDSNSSTSFPPLIKSP